MKKVLGVDNLLSPIYLMFFITITLGLLLGAKISLIFSILVEFVIFYNIELIAWLVIDLLRD